MNLEFMSRKLFLLAVAVILPAILLIAALALDASICVVMALLMWVGLALILVYLPRSDMSEQS